MSNLNSSESNWVFPCIQGLLMTLDPHSLKDVSACCALLLKPACCYALGERLARLELGGYDFVVWHVVLEAYASDTR